MWKFLTKEYLRKEVRLFPKRKALSPFARKVQKVFQWLMVLLLSTFVIWRVLLYAEVNRRFDRIHATGQPTSGAELNRWPGTVSDAENGALVITQAFALIQTFADGRSNEVGRLSVPTRTNEWSAETGKLVEAYVEMNRPALAKAHEAFHFSQFRYPVDFSYGPDTELPHLSRLKSLALLAAFEAEINAGEADAERRSELVDFQLKLAATLDGEPFLISHLVRGGIIRMGVRTLERNLNHFSPNEETCKHLQAAFASVGSTNLLPFVLVGERATLIPVFRMSWKEIQSTNQEKPQKPARRHQYLGKPAKVIWLTGFFERDLNFFLGTMEDSIVRAALPAPNFLSLTNYFESSEKVALKKGHFYSAMLLLPLQRVVVREASTLAHVELARTALAIERFRSAHGQPPENLKELTPQFLDSIPIDPFDGAPLRYRRLERGYLIYSVDVDGADDGGKEKPEQKKSGDRGSYDITFIVER